MTLVIKKKYLTDLSDCLREKRVKKDLAYVASSVGSSFFGTEPWETNRLCLCVNLAL